MLARSYREGAGAAGTQRRTNLEEVPQNFQALDWGLLLVLGPQELRTSTSARPHISTVHRAKYEYVIGFSRLRGPTPHNSLRPQAAERATHPPPGLHTLHTPTRPGKIRQRYLVAQSLDLFFGSTHGSSLLHDAAKVVGASASGSAKVGASASGSAKVGTSGPSGLTVVGASVARSAVVGACSCR